MLARVIKNDHAPAFVPLAIPELGDSKPHAAGVREFVYQNLSEAEMIPVVAAAPAKDFFAAPSAEDVLQTARAEAAQLIADAEARSEMIEQAAREKALIEARASIEAENSTYLDELRSQLAATIQQVSALSEEITNRVEKDVVELALEIAKKVVAREVTIDRQIAFTLVKVSLAKLHSRSVAQVHLNPEDFAFVESAREKLGFRGALELVEDRSISMGGCLIHTETGEIDGRIKSQFEEITHGLLHA